MPADFAAARISCSANSVGVAATGIASPSAKKIVESGRRRDRKSTRLNSSHQIISYARSPGSTLFPYTTLFRSALGATLEAIGLDAQRRVHGEGHAGRGDAGGFRRGANFLFREFRGRGRHRHRQPQRKEDRGEWAP